MKNAPQYGKALTWAIRIAFTAVFVMNVQCALSFIASPATFAGAYELEGVAGNAAVQGIGIAFLMWNTTYPAFIASPNRFPVLGRVIIAQQVVGLAGESWLYATLPVGHQILASSILRFIVFDTAGLIVMAAVLLVAKALARRN